jgi:hypothetical protein
LGYGEKTLKEYCAEFYTGFCLKYVIQKIDRTTAQTFSADFGLVYQTFLENVWLGACERFRFEGQAYQFL